MGLWEGINEGEVLNNFHHLFPFYFYLHFLLKALMEQCWLERHQPEGQNLMRHALHLRQRPVGKQMEKFHWPCGRGGDPAQFA